LPNFNATVIAQICNFIVLIIFLAVPIVLVFKLFGYFKSLDRRMRKLEEILIEKGGQRQNQK